jgi:hypothetical protein
MTLQDFTRTRTGRFTGLALLLAAAWLLLTAPGQFSTLHFLLFLGLFVPGVLLAGWPWSWFVTSPNDLAAPAGFRRAMFVVAALLAAGLFGLGVVLLAFGRDWFPGGLADALAVSAIPLFGGAGLLVYLWRKRLAAGWGREG